MVKRRSNIRITMKMKKKTNKTIKFQDSKFFFDDCPICKAMKEAEEKGKDLTMVELAEAFGKAKKQGAIVGGSIFNKDDSIY